MPPDSCPWRSLLRRASVYHRTADPLPCHHAQCLAHLRTAGHSSATACPPRSFPLSVGVRSGDADMYTEEVRLSPRRIVLCAIPFALTAVLLATVLVLVPLPLAARLALLA